ncbi:hypothetical protein M0R45_028679 [Rubus argutus]|uniref:Uncharacterized protein n=1 Tax=Rubus argutus TaxID=59490 RepID=A0AAW1W807_RUBAR
MDAGVELAALKAEEEGLAANWADRGKAQRKQGMQWLQGRGRGCARMGTGGSTVKPIEEAHGEIESPSVMRPGLSKEDAVELDAVADASSMAGLDDDADNEL